MGGRLRNVVIQLMTLAETATKLGVSFYHYIHDRVSGACQMPSLADLIEERAQVLNLGAGTNPLAGGYLRVTTNGLIQVDLNGGGDSWATLSSINGTAAVTVRYLSGGSASSVAVSRSGDGAALLTADTYGTDVMHVHGHQAALSPDVFGL